MWHPYGKGIENGHIYAICLPPTHPWKKMGYYLHEKREYEEVVSFSPSHSLHFILPPSPHPFLSPSLSPFPLLLRSSYYCSSHSQTPWGFSPRVNSQCRPSYAVFVQPSCAIACINICAYVKDPEHWQPHLCLDTGKYRTHH